MREGKLRRSEHYDFATRSDLAFPNLESRKEPLDDEGDSGVERETGLEPATPTLARSCSTN